MRENRRGGPEPRWLAILEDIRSQNRATLAAVLASRVAFEERIDRLEKKTDSWFDKLEAAICSTDKSIAALGTHLETLERKLSRP